MQPTDFQAFKKIISGMGRIYGVEADGLILDAYWLALKSWPLDEFEQAAGYLLANSQFMPRPADFTKLRKAGEETAGEAFAKVLAYVRGNQRGESPGGRIDRVVRAMGGYNVFGGDVSGTPFREKRFAELWAETGEVEKTREALPSVAAIPALRQLSDMKRVGRA